MPLATNEEYRKAYLDGMTGTEWCLWAQRLNWLQKVNPESESDNHD